jgi:hypothetical protein
MLFQLLLKLSPALEAGKELTNSDVWRDRHRAFQLVMAVLTLAVGALQWQGIDLGLSPTDLAEIGMGIASAGYGVSYYLSIITNKNAGIGKKKMEDDNA